MMTNKKLFISDTLNVGEKNAISQHELCEILHIKPRVLKRHVQEERRSGVLILSSNRGYYLPRDDADVAAFYRKEKAQALCRLKTLKAFRAWLKTRGIL